MNTHYQTAIPYHNGRRQHEIPCVHQPPPPTPQTAAYYHGYQQQYPPQHFQQQQPHQWYQYPHMHAPMHRPYQQYPPIAGTHYAMPQNHLPMQHRPHPPTHASSSSPARSHQELLSPTSSSTSLHVPLHTPSLAPSPRLRTPVPPPSPTRRMPYYPPLPWYSLDDHSFPPRTPRRRKRRPPPQSPSQPVKLPRKEEIPSVLEETTIGVSTVSQDQSISDDLPTQSDAETPVTSHANSEADSTQPTTPSSVVTPIPPPNKSLSGSKAPSRVAVPIVPAIPNLPKIPRPQYKKAGSITSANTKATEPLQNLDHPTHVQEVAKDASTPDSQTAPDLTSPTAPPTVKAAPKSWADLVRTKAQSGVPIAPTPIESVVPQTNGFATTKNASLSDVLASFDARSSDENHRISFLEPRGLVNTGNMCYMNAVLQILLFCTPFYDFLDMVSKRAAHSFKNDTPMLDAMIMFTREFRVIDSAVSVEQLRMRLKDTELEQYGEAFIPEFVYEVIRRLPRFSTMRRGHQQDAEEFLGFLLEEMHDECARALKISLPAPVSEEGAASNGPIVPSNNAASGDESGWLEVGPKQKAAITRSSGNITNESPITKIFGGKLRSELRVPGMKNSVTLEPYQPLQLYIGSTQINNITDALKGLTHSETLHGEFGSPRGPGMAATKQVTIESLPPVLILHLKRFQYDNAGGTQKIWRKIGYPLELEIPREVFPQHRRAAMLAHGGFPKYRLVGVIYHHGKNASGGHYTVDVRRQDGREWIRLDDTVIRRVRSEDVAEGGSEEDPKVLAAALEQHKRDESASSNIFDRVAEQEEDQAQSEKGWSQVNGTPSGSASTTKKWSGVVDGFATPATISSGKRTPVGRYNLKDNKVAYLLFYQRINA